MSEVASNLAARSRRERGWVREIVPTAVTLIVDYSCPDAISSRKQRQTIRIHAW